MTQDWKISRRPIGGKWAVRTRTNNIYLGTIEPLGKGKGYTATRPNGKTRTERLRMFAADWLSAGPAEQTEADEMAKHHRYNAIQAELDVLRYSTPDGCDVNAAAICELEIELVSLDEYLTTHRAEVVY